MLSWLITSALCRGLHSLIPSFIRQLQTETVASELSDTRRKIADSLRRLRSVSTPRSSPALQMKLSRSSTTLDDWKSTLIWTTRLLPNRVPRWAVWRITGACRRSLMTEYETRQVWPSQMEG
ncbi:hypothetical protein BJX70DRAFT_19376 [Aspergillus crustosus]